MRGLEELLAKTAVCARDGMPEECLGRFTEDAFNERVDVCLRQLLLICVKHRNLLRSRKREVRHGNCYFIPTQVMNAKLLCHLQRIVGIPHG